MKVIKCKSCGKPIHFGSCFDNACIFCGVTNTTSEDSSSETHISRLSKKGEGHLRNREFTKALSVYDEAVYLYPNVSSLYWGRLLAKHSCSSDIELIQKGIDLRNAPDYRVALHLASEEEAQCYTTIKTIRDSVATELVSELQKLEYKSLLATGVIEKQPEYAKRIAELRERLTLQIGKLDENERDIRNTATDCNSLVESEKTRLSQFVLKAERIKTEIASKSEVTKVAFDDYVKSLEQYKTLCQAEADLIKSKSNVPAFSRIKSYQKTQGDLERDINATIDEIKRVSSDQSRLLTSITQIKDKHKIARTDLEKGSFIRAIALVGKDSFTRIVTKYIRVS